MAVRDRWHLARPEPGARKCGKHRGYPSAEHGVGLQWQVRVTDADGKPLPRRNFQYEEDAKAYDAELKAQIKSDTYIDERAGKVTFEAFAESWRRHRTHDPETARRIKSEFTNHVYESPEPSRRGRTVKGGQALGHHDLRTLARRPDIVQAWIKGMPVSANTKLLIIADVSQVFRAAIAGKKIADNPLKSELIQRPKAEKSKAQAWTARQVEAVAAQLPPELADMPRLGASCGQRQGELFALDVDDLDFARGMCHVDAQLKWVITEAGTVLAFAATKNQSVRDVPVSGRVLDGLERHLEVYPPIPVSLPWMKVDGTLGKPVTRRLVFARPDGTPWTRGIFNPVWRRAWRAAGIPEADQINGLHVVRHTAASVWLGNGLSLAKAAAYLGDTQAIVLKTYSHFMPDDDERARVIMDAFFGAPERARSLQSPYPSVD